MKTPELPFENPSALDSLDCKQPLRFTPRQARVLSALEGTEGWVWREDVDRIAGASNGPQIIMELRRKVTGHDGIDLERVDRIDRDGRPCHPGRYRLNEIGRQRLARHEGGCHGERTQ